MKFAVVEIAGKQFLVREGDIVETPKLTATTGGQVTFPQILLFWDGERIALGRPCVENLVVEGTVVEEGKGPKLVVYKYKRRKGYHRKKGHRQDVCEVSIRRIGKPSGEKEAPEKAEATAAPKPPARKKPIARKAPPRKRAVIAKKPAGKRKDRKK